MDPKEALDKALAFAPGTRLGSVTNKYKNLYIFELVPENYGRGAMVFDSLFSVDENTGKVSQFVPSEHPDYNMDTIEFLDI